MDVNELKKELSSLSDPKRAEVSKWFFKTKEGEYGHGDKFLGITVPLQRKVAHKFLSLSLPEVKELLKSRIHEHRFVGLEILVTQYERGNKKVKKDIADFYLKNIRYVNNWDLVDTSAEYILGDYFFNKSKYVLFSLARSENIWEKRIAIISTFNFIKKNRFNETLKILEILISDTHDLIHKASGWMLREVGNRSLETEIKFLDKHYMRMPRTMLRYAIEKFPKEKRLYYLKKKTSN